ncbi:MAG: ATP-binding cassette domain-containing protein [Arachnia sp.]
MSEPSRKATTVPLLSVDDLSVGFEMYSRGFQRELIYSVRHLSLSVDRGEVLGIAGESGSGKSLLAHAILGLLPYNAVQTGQVLLDDTVLTPGMTTDTRSRLALVPQSVTYLDPLMAVGRQLVEGPGTTPPSAAELAQIARRFSLSRGDLDKIPSELSGGMIRRILLATAMLSKADLIVADEPTPGIPVDMAKDLLADLRDLATQGCGVIVISHDVDLIAQIADRIAILRDGELVTALDAAAFADPDAHDNHPYAEALWRALPDNDFASTAQDAS